MIVGLLIGRFQPFHLGHLEALHFALTKVDKLCIGIGSSNKPIQKNNPFSAQERKKMIESSICNDPIKEKISFYLIPDVDNHIKWIDKINDIVPKFDIIFTNDALTKHLYSNKTKVQSVPFIKRDQYSGTNVRDSITNNKRWQDLVPLGTRNFLSTSEIKDRLKNL